MKRTEEHILEQKAILALKKLLAPEWILADMTPDYGLDMEATAVEGTQVTTKVLKLQLKATKTIESQRQMPSLRMQTKHLKYYENYPVPVIIVYYIEPQGAFYYLFAQRYIRENLSVEKPRWKGQKTVTITFPSGSKLENTVNLKSIGTNGYKSFVPGVHVSHEWSDASTTEH